MHSASLNILVHISWYRCTRVALGVEFLSHGVETCLCYQDNSKLFSKVDVLLWKAPIITGCFDALYPCQQFNLFNFLIFTSLVDVKWHFLVVLFTGLPERLRIFSYVYWPFVFPLLEVAVLG